MHVNAQRPVRCVRGEMNAPEAAETDFGDAPSGLQPPAMRDAGIDQRRTAWCAFDTEAKHWRVVRECGDKRSDVRVDARPSGTERGVRAVGHYGFRHSRSVVQEACVRAVTTASRKSR